MKLCTSMRGHGVVQRVGCGDRADENQHDEAHALLPVVDPWKKLTPVQVRTIKARMGQGGGLLPLGAS